MAYSTLSKELTARLGKETKQAQGIYFTPPACVARNLALLAPYLASGEFKDVLEPACGSGEYLTALRAAYPAMRLTGIEYNRTIYEAIQGLDATLLHENYLAYRPQTLMYGSATLYDLIIGNPPYFVMAKSHVPKAYHPYFDGRPNMFILFLLHSLRLLRPGGLLSFILPKNFLNCLYYDKTRAYLNKKCEILFIEECSTEKYLETQQETIIFIARKRQTKAKANAALKTIKLKKKTNKAFILERQGYTIFAPPASIPILNALYQDSTSLAALGFKVSVGTVVWNQCKDILTADARETRLIYSSDIVDNKLVMKTYPNEEKKNFIQQAGWTHPLLIVNRGYGVGDYKFNYCLLDGTLLAPYLIENHLIYIDSLTIRTDLLEAYEKIIASFNDERTAAFIRAYCGNNALNTTELATILPIYT